MPEGTTVNLEVPIAQTRSGGSYIWICNPKLYLILIFKKCKFFIVLFGHFLFSHLQKNQLLRKSELISFLFSHSAESLIAFTQLLSISACLCVFLPSSLIQLLLQDLLGQSGSLQYFFKLKPKFISTESLNCPLCLLSYELCVVFFFEVFCPDC